MFVIRANDKYASKELICRLEINSLPRKSCGFGLVVSEGMDKLKRRSFNCRRFKSLLPQPASVPLSCKTLLNCSQRASKICTTLNLLCLQQYCQNALSSQATGISRKLSNMKVLLLNVVSCHDSSCRTVLPSGVAKTK